jgi:hypothetical protein
MPGPARFNLNEDEDLTPPEAGEEEEEGELEAEAGEEEEEELPPAPRPRAVAPLPVAAAPARRAPGRPRKQPGLGAPRRAPTNPDVPADFSLEALKRSWSKEIDVAWPAIIEWVSRGCPGQEGGPYSMSEVEIRVYRVSSASGMATGAVDPVVKGIEVLGNAPGGNPYASPPGEVLKDTIIDKFHRFVRGPASYRAQFRFNRGERRWIFDSDTFPLDSIEVIDMRRQAIEQDRQRAGGGGFQQGMPQGYGRPPQHQPPWMQQQPYGYPYPPPPWAQMQPPPWAQQYGYGAPQQGASEADALRTELERSREREAFMRGEISAAAREGRQVRIDDLPPPPPMPSTEEIAQRVASILQPQQAQAPAGLGAPPPSGMDPQMEMLAQRVAQILRPGLGAPIAPAQPAGFERQLNGMVQTLMQQVVQSTFKQVQDRMTTVVTGEDIAPESIEVPAPIEQAAAESPEDLMPFKAVKINDEIKWPDGSPVMNAVKTDGSGKIDPLGFAMSNPFVGGKLMDIAQGFGNAAQDVMRRMSAQGQPHVVNNIPRAAIESGPVAPGDSWERKPI